MLAQRVGQVRGRDTQALRNDACSEPEPAVEAGQTNSAAPFSSPALCNNVQLLPALRDDVHPEPHPAVGAAKTDAAAPFSSPALCYNGLLLLALRNDIHPEPDPAVGAAKTEAAAPFSSPGLRDKRQLLQVFSKFFPPPGCDAVVVVEKAKAIGEQNRRAECRGQGENRVEPRLGFSQGKKSQCASQLLSVRQ